ncbi:S-adenosylmethionine decarboxylase proenzyme [Rubritalea halochordaticola]|uniref:S-adenosylmethionine decarboxylase proenzyme n=1 Tax=Rubritalea halochordaticola TaxID=714537 RepID=A0ABP9V5G3_9BACT
MSVSLNLQAPDLSAHQAHGCHLLLECSGCEPDLLTDRPLLEGVLEKAASEAGATVVKTFLHEFNPHGLSGVVVIAESHIAIHTWPEHHYAAIDIFTCGMPEVAERIYAKLLTAFKPHKHQIKRLERKPPE